MVIVYAWEILGRFTLDSHRLAYHLRRTFLLRVFADLRCDLFRTREWRRNLVWRTPKWYSSGRMNATMNGERGTKSRVQSSEYREQLRERTTDNGQRTTDNSQWTTDYGQRSTVKSWEFCFNTCDSRDTWSLGPGWLRGSRGSTRILLCRRYYS